MKYVVQAIFSTLRLLGRGFSHQILIMNPNTTNATQESASGPSSVNTEHCALSLGTGIVFSRFNKCLHDRAFSASSAIACSFCNQLRRLYSFHVKTKCVSNRLSLSLLANLPFDSLFNISCLLFVPATTVGGNNHKRNASTLAYGRKLGCQHACPGIGNVGDAPEEPNCDDSWNICDNVEHIFECYGSRDFARRKFFTIPRKGYSWNTTCKACGASCSFAGPREGMILAIFFQLLRVFYTGERYEVTVTGCEERVHCSRHFAELIVLMQGGSVIWDGLKMKNKDPLFYLIRDKLIDHPCYEIGCFQASNDKRYAKDESVTWSYDCEHEFYLTSSLGEQLQLSKGMMRIFMMLLPCDGYLYPETVMSGPSGCLDSCGLRNIGGMATVRLRANSNFLIYHSEFYKGAMRTPDLPSTPTFTPSVFICDGDEENFQCRMQSSVDFSSLVNLTSNPLSDQDLESWCCQAQASSEEEYSTGSETEYEEVPDIVQLVRDFKRGDANLLEIPMSSSRTQARGLGDLAKRVGGLLKSVTHCVTRLHAVWDWPLDTLLKAIDDTGKFLAKNQESVGDVWACQMCTTIQNEFAITVAYQNDMLKLLQESVKKLATTLDNLSVMNRDNFQEIENKFKKLEAKDEKFNSRQFLGRLQGSLTTLGEELSEVSRKVFALENTLSEPTLSDLKMEDLRKQVEKLEEQIKRKDIAKVPTRFKPTPMKDDDDGVGEQMSIPRRAKARYRGDMPFEFQDQVRKGKASIDLTEKQSAIPEFEGGEVTRATHPGTPVVARGLDQTHNVLLSSFLLGTFDWKVSDGSGKIIKSFNLPTDMFANNQRLSDFARYFQYWSCDGMEFTITTTSIGMQGGTLMVSWDAKSCAQNQKINSVLQLSNLPCVFLDASSSQRCVLEVKSPALQYEMCLSGSEFSEINLGTLAISCANVLNAPAETSQNIAVNVWVKFTNPKFNFLTTRHELVYAQGECSLGKIQGIESVEAIVAEGKWSTTSSGTLMSLSVHPTACHVSNGLVTQTSLSVISHFYARWRGSMKYRLIFGASLFVRGKLMVSAVPVVFRTENMSLKEMASFPSIVCDMSVEQREFVIEVPYFSIGTNSVVCRDTLYDISSYNPTLVVSRLHILILDKLVMNANASNSIEFFVTAQPGSDFVLEYFMGVKTEYVDRTLKQSFGVPLKASNFKDTGFDAWVHQQSILHKFSLSESENNALCLMVSPCYRAGPPCITSLSWICQLFVEWNGSLVYTLRCHSHDRSKSSLVRIWHDVNGSTQEDTEYEFVSDVEPPAGAFVTYWKPFEQAECVVRVPYCARTPKLLLPKARYVPSESDWLKYFNGMLVIDYEGKGNISVELSIAGGRDFDLFEQTVAPRCGNVTTAFTTLSYHDKLGDIKSFPSNTKRLSGPVNKAIVEPIVFKPVAAVDQKGKQNGPTSTARQKPRKVREPQEGDTDVDEDGNRIIFLDGEWDYYTAEAQMGCTTCIETVGDISHTAEVLRDHETVQKVADLIDKTHEFAGGENKEANNIIDSLKFLMPLLKRAERFSGSMEDKVAEFSGMKDSITSVVKTLLKESIPGMMASVVSHDGYFWGTLVTIVAGLALFWFCKSRRKFMKKLTVLCMIVWSPFLLHRVWDLGKVLKKQFDSCFGRNFDDETCRKHSGTGTFEGTKKTFGSFADWFSGNWASTTQSLLTVLGIIASLIMWGSIPDTKKLASFSEKFKEAGNKGRTFTNIFSGFSSIYKMCSEWSSKFVSWVLGCGGSGLPKSDSALQTYVDFDIKEWVTSTRHMFLQENRFVGFGAQAHLETVRHLYDKSEKIQDALMSGVKVDMQLSMIIKDCKEKCTELFNDTHTYKGMKMPRIDPLHVCIIGKPGVGKSATTHVIINNLLDYRGEPKIDRVYTRCCADQYWSSYRHEPVILYDDLGAINTKLKLSDYAEIMGIKTNDPFSVPMAAVEDKGKHCTSKYIFSCTNVLELDDTGDVVTKEAYYRRRNVLVEVERDPDVPRSEENPTQGLLYTVMGYVKDGDRVVFGIKSVWDEPFLKDVDTRQWRFERVTFKTFLRFLCVYTDAYMTSQERLLKGSDEYRIDPFEDDVVEAQVGLSEKIISLEEVVKTFDEQGFSSTTFYKLLRTQGYEAPRAWNTDKKMGLVEMMDTMCECSGSKACCFDIMHSHIGAIAFRAGGLLPATGFIVKDIRKDWRDTTVKINKPNFMQGCGGLALFHYIVNMIRYSTGKGLCPAGLQRQGLREKQRKAFDLKHDEILFEDKIPDNCKVVPKGKDTFVEWPSLAKFFPSACKVFGYLAVNIGSDWIILTQDINTSLDLKSKKEVWKAFWEEGFETPCDVLSLVPYEDRMLVRALLDEIDDFGSLEKTSAKFSEMVLTAKEWYGCSGTFYATLLYIINGRARRVDKYHDQNEVDEKKRRFLERTGKLDDYEKKMHEGLSDKAKIGLAIGGGIAAVGILVGLVMAVKGLFGMMTSQESEGEDECDAIPEMSSGSSSGNFNTNYVYKGRDPPKGVTIHRVEPQRSGIKVGEGVPVKKRAKGPNRKPRVEKQRGFGVTYGDDDVNTLLAKERRKASRKNFANSVKIANKSIKSGKNNVTTNTQRWHASLINKNVKPAPKSESVLLDRLQTEVDNLLEKPTAGDVVAKNKDFEVDEDTVAAIEELFFTPQDSLDNLTQKGTNVQTEKQARVGDVGVMRDAHMVELLTTHVSKMSCALLLRDPANMYHKFNVLRLTGTYILMPAHYIEMIHLAQDIFFITPDKIVRVDAHMNSMVLVSEFQDLVVWDLGHAVPPSPNFMKHIISEKDWEKFQDCSGVLSITKPTTEDRLQMVHHLDSIERIKCDVELPTGTYPVDEFSHTILEGLRYRVHCIPGFCGAAILRADSRAQKKIIGMHVAGRRDKGVGYAEALSFERLERAIQTLGDISVRGSLKEHDVGMCEKQCVEIENKGNLGVLGQLERQFVPNVPSKTSIAESAIHGMIGEVESEPAILSTWDYRLGEKRGSWNPVLDGVVKYGVPVKPFDREEIKMVEKFLVSKFENASNSLRKRSVNDVEIGINGIDGTDFWAPMEMKTSAGYPYVLHKPANASGKKWLFEHLGTYPSGRDKYGLKDGDFKTSFESKHASILDGEVPIFLTMECPKDERRKLSKIYDKPATRTFSILPAEINLLFRMYFGDFAAMIMETREQHFSQVGINPESLEWSELMTNLLKVGKRGFAGDYAKFDGIGSPQIYHSIVNVVNNWYNDGPINARARHCLISSIVHRDGIADQFILKYSQGMPSGFSMTVIFNSFVNYYYMALAWHDIISKTVLRPQSALEYFDYYTKIIVYGDDNVVAVDDDFLPFYNLQTVALYLSQYGITYTDDAKNPIHLSEPHVDIRSVTFLKRGFVKLDRSGNLWKAPLNKVSIEERCNWIRSCEVPIEALDQNIDSALYEASIHSREYYDDLKKRINYARSRVVLKPYIHSYEESRRRWWGNMTSFSYAQQHYDKIQELESKKKFVDLTNKYKHVVDGTNISLLEALRGAKSSPLATYMP